MAHGLLNARLCLLAAISAAVAAPAVDGGNVNPVALDADPAALSGPICRGFRQKALCCQGSFLGFLHTGCSQPFPRPDSVSGFIKGCDSSGLSAQCCTISLLGGSVLCRTPSIMKADGSSEGLLGANSQDAMEYNLVEDDGVVQVEKREGSYPKYNGPWPTVPIVSPSVPAYGERSASPEYPPPPPKDPYSPPPPPKDPYYHHPPPKDPYPGPPKDAYPKPPKKDHYPEHPKTPYPEHPKNPYPEHPKGPYHHKPPKDDYGQGYHGHPKTKTVTVTATVTKDVKKPGPTSWCDPADPKCKPFCNPWDKDCTDDGLCDDWDEECKKGNKHYHAYKEHEKEQKPEHKPEYKPKDDKKKDKSKEKGKPYDKREDWVDADPEFDEMAGWDEGEADAEFDEMAQWLDALGEWDEAGAEVEWDEVEAEEDD